MSNTFADLKDQSNPNIQLNLKGGQKKLIQTHTFPTVKHGKPVYDTAF